MLADILIYLGIATAGMTLLDLLLSDRRKQNISELILRVWNYVDDASRTSLVDWLRRRRRKAWHIVIFLLVAAIVPAGLIIWVDHRAIFSVETLGLVSGFYALLFFTIILSGFYALKGLAYALDADSPAYILFRAIWYVLVASSISIAILYFAMRLLDYPSYSGMLSLILTLLAMLLFTIIFTILFTLVIAPLAIAYLIQFGLICSEFVVRRIAENSKGPLLAVSLLIAAVGTILKVFA
jgi:hypothetical protein